MATANRLRNKLSTCIATMRRRIELFLPTRHWVFGVRRLRQPRTVFLANRAGSFQGSMSEQGVRRAKAALSSGCKSHPATAPAGSNRSSHGGNEVAEAFD